MIVFYDGSLHFWVIKYITYIFEQCYSSYLNGSSPDLGWMWIVFSTWVHAVHRSSLSCRSLYMHIGFFFSCVCIDQPFRSWIHLIKVLLSSKWSTYSCCWTFVLFEFISSSSCDILRRSCASDAFDMKRKILVSGLSACAWKDDGRNPRSRFMTASKKSWFLSMRIALKQFGEPRLLSSSFYNMDRSQILHEVFKDR